MSTYPRVRTVYNPHTGSFWYIEISDGHGNRMPVSKDKAKELIKKLEKEIENE
jgi:hypothetical protein